MPANPKQFYGDTKVPLNLFPSTAIAVGAMGFMEGRLKYGQDNFRAAPVEAMTYVRAAMSHILLYAEGEDSPSDSPVPHLGLALASIAILIDATYAGSLIDNRKYPGGYQKALAEMQPLVAKLREMHGDKNPRHYDIRDTPVPTPPKTPGEVFMDALIGAKGVLAETGKIPERMPTVPSVVRPSNNPVTPERLP